MVETAVERNPSGNTYTYLLTYTYTYIIYCADSLWSMSYGVIKA